MGTKLAITLILTFGLFFLVKAEGDGYGENPGGAGGDTIVVDNAGDLKTYAGLDEPYVILIQGTIDVGSDVRVRSFKTISGIDTSSTIVGDINISAGANNVVIKNLNITNPANDGITIREAKYVYVTNCTVYDCADGCIDVTVESDFVTISYCRFYYDQVENHKFVNLIGADDSNITDRGKLHVTMHNNWWDTGCTSRMPRVRFGRVHVYNNYLSCIDSHYSSRAAIEAQILSENNYYEGVRDPLTVDQDGKARSVGNEYVDCIGEIYEGLDEVFTPSYEYVKISAIDAKDSTVKIAGNTNLSPLETTEKKETIINWEEPEDILFGTAISETQLNATSIGNTSTPVYSHAVGTVLSEGFHTLTVTFQEDENYKAASKTINFRVNYEYVTLSIDAVDATYPGLISVYPEGVEENGALKFPVGTEVVVKASSDFVSTFDHWQDGETSDSLKIVMNEDINLTAYYNQLNYIVAWDLYEAGNYDRPADFYSLSENQDALLQLKKDEDVGISFTLYSEETTLFGKNAAMIRRGSSSVGDYFFQISFNAAKYENISVSANMLGLYSYYQVQNVEYSLDGSSFTKIGEFNLEQDSTWYPGSFQLPESANGAEQLTIRFKADKSSALVVNGLVGTSISEIVVFGDERNNTYARENIQNKRVLEKQYFSIDGKRLSEPLRGLNIVLFLYDDGSRETKKIVKN